MITVVSLGAVKGGVSLAGIKAIKAAEEVIVRTGTAPAVKTLDDEHIPYTTLDHLYEKSRNYDTLTNNIVKELRRRGKEKNICYCVDGSVTEDVAACILMQGREKPIVIDGVSKSSHIALLAGLEGGYTASSAFELSEKKLALPLVVYDLTEDNAPDVKLLLADRFGDEAPACFVVGENATRMPLYELDRQDTYENAAVVLYDVPLLEKKRFDLEDFLSILRLLRAPDGCPWDRVQTHESIRINCIEEAYELVDAIDQNDPEKMREEAGDVIMQAAFHTLMEEEKGNFNMTDVLSEVCLKLISRHTHVFGQDKAQSADGALSVWEKNKMTEKGQKTFSDAVNDVPTCFPALLRAQKIAKRMEKGGWDKATFENCERKFREEYLELREAYASGDKEKISEELGDVLMCAVEIGRAVGGECEQALLDCVKKLQARFTAYESLVLSDGKDVLSLTEEEKLSYYKRAKDAARA